MREIKFRGKDVKTGKWVFGYYAKLNIPITDPHDKVVGWKRCPSIWNDEPGSRKQGSYWHSVAPETVGQFTGLKTREGVEIYEGDIISIVHNNKLQVIIWKEEYGGFYTSPTFLDLFDAIFEYNVSRVLGNIHDNPELRIEAEAEK